MNKHRHSMVRLSLNQGGGAEMEPDEDGAWVPNWYAGELEDALRKSLELQSHYATLLNMHDGGTRMTFASVDQWCERLREVERMNKRKKKPQSP